jgi:hypothetical protein
VAAGCDEATAGCAADSITTCADASSHAPQANRTSAVAQGLKSADRQSEVIMAVMTSGKRSPTRKPGRRRLPHTKIVPTRLHFGKLFSSNPDPCRRHAIDRKKAQESQKGNLNLSRRNMNLFVLHCG